MSEHYDVTVSFEDLEVARRAAELLSVTFPMLTFELNCVPELDLSLNTQNFLNFSRTTTCHSCKHNKEDILFSSCRNCKYFNVYCENDNYESL